MAGAKGKFLTAVIIFAVLCSAAGAAGYVWVHDYSVKKVRKETSRFNDIVQVDFEDAMINPLDESLRIDGVKFKFAMGSTASARQVRIMEFDRKHRIPHFMHLEAEQVDVPVNFMNFGTLSSDLKKMGYERLTFDLAADYIYEDGTKRLVLRKLVLDGKDSAQVSIGLGVEDVKLGSPGIGGLVGVSVYNGGMVWRDHSFISRLLDCMAARKSMDREQYTRGILRKLQLQKQSAMSRGNGHAEEFYAGVQAFLEDPSTLSLRVEPQEAVPLLYIFMGRDLDEILSLYGVRVEAGDMVPVAGNE